MFDIISCQLLKEIEVIIKNNQMAVTFYNNWKQGQEFTFLVLDFEYSKPFLTLTIGLGGVGVVFLKRIG